MNNDGDPDDDNNHGTHVAGIVGAVGNSIGVIGAVGPLGVQLMILKFLGSSGSGSTSDAIAAIDYAVLMGAHVSNNSWGGGGFSQSLLNTIENAGTAGQVFVAAAGNDALNNDLFPHYPSSYTPTPDDNIIAVASTDRNDNLSSFSNTGLASVDLAAPGSDILSTLPNGTYGLLSGTSMATPHVSAAAALLYGPKLLSQTAQTTSNSHLQVKSEILASVDFLSNLTGQMLTEGRLNLFTALISQWLSIGISSATTPFGSSVTFPVTATANGLLPDTYSASIVFTSNDPDEPTFTVLVTLIVDETGGISGYVHYIDNPLLPVPGVEVTLSSAANLNGQVVATAVTVTDPDGLFTFPNVPSGDHTVTMAKTGDTDGAITGADPVYILQHAASLLPLEDKPTADQRTSGDVNLDGFLDITDALGDLRIWAELDPPSWDFDPRQSPISTGSAQTTSAQTPLASGGTVPNVKAFVRGDVQPSWNGPLTKPASGLPLSVDASGAEWKGDRLVLPIQVHGQGPLGSLLMSLNYDPALFRYGATRLAAAGRGYLLVDNGEREGQIHIALAGIPRSSAGGPVFDLVLHTQTTAETGPPVDSAEFTLTRIILNDVVYPVDAESTLKVRKIPERFELVQNYPNPFNPQTQIRFGLPEQTRVRLTIYNALGQEVRVLADEEMAPGFYTLAWDGLTSRGAQVSSGVYIYRLHTSSGFTDTRRMLLLK